MNPTEINPVPPRSESTEFAPRLSERTLRECEEFVGPEFDKLVGRVTDEILDYSVALYPRDLEGPGPASDKYCDYLRRNLRVELQYILMPWLWRCQDALESEGRESAMSNTRALVDEQIVQSALGMVNPYRKPNVGGE